MRDSISFYRSQCEALEQLPPEQFKAAMIAMWRYGMDDQTPDGSDPVAMAMWLMAKPLIDRNNKNASNRNESKRTVTNNNETERNVTNDNEQKRTTTNHEPKEKGESINIIKEKPPKGGKEKSAVRFSPPTVEEVAEYVREKGYNVDAARFVDFYASKGWKVGTAGMKDWKAAVRNWSRTQREEQPPKRLRQETTARPHNFAQREVDYDTLLASGTWG